MSFIHNSALAGASGQGGVYEIEQSLRFDGSEYIDYSDTAFGNEIGTYSFWVKRSELGVENTILWNTRVGGHWGFRFNGDNTFTLFKTAGGIDSSTNTTAVFRDTSAWYHILVTTTSTANEIFVNGTSLATGSYEWAWIDANPRIGYRSSTSNFHGYLAEWHYISGSVKTVSDFTETDNNGVLRPIEYTGTYGTNGYYLKFDPSLTNGILHDSSGQGNDFGSSTGLVTSGTGTDVMSDTPTTNWCTLNPVGSTAASQCSNGSLQYYNGTTSAWRSGVSSFAVSSGKWYFEAKFTSFPASSAAFVGISPDTLQWVNNASHFGQGSASGSYGYYSNNGYIYTGGSSSSYGATYTTNDVIGVALDLDAGTLHFYKNGTDQGEAASGLTGTWNVGVSSLDTPAVVNFGQRAFEQTPPTGFKALNTSNLPAPAIKDGSKYFDTLTYTGPISSTAAAGTTGAVTGLASGFTPDLVWIKCRSHGQVHNLFDIVRGVNADGSGQLLTNSNTSEYTTNYNGGLASFDDGGFTVKAGIDTGGRSNNTGSSDRTYVAWCWDAGGSVSADNNTAGSITSTVSANLTAGFSIVTYTGTGTAGTVGHGLGRTPSFYVVKPRSYSNNWPCWHKDLTSDGYYIHLNHPLKQDLATAVWNGTGPSNTVFNIGTNTNVNQLNATFVAYVFAEIEGYSKISYYAGNGSTEGPFVYCGFRPAFVLIKNYRGGSETNWIMRDSARSPNNKVHPSIYANTADTEINNFDMDFLSNGFKIKDDNAVFNESGSDYLFLAFAENPFGGLGVSPATAR